MLGISYLNPSNSTSVISKSAIHQQSDPAHSMEISIRTVAAEISHFVHQLVRISVTAETRLYLDADESFTRTMLWDMSSGETKGYLRSLDQRIGAVRDNIYRNAEKKIAAGQASHRALVQAYSDHAIEVMLSNLGNCGEKAFLAGIFMKALMEKVLEHKGFSQEEIEQANIQVYIASNQKHGGDHGVCVVGFDANGEQELYVDPWLRGSIYKREEAQQLFSDIFFNPDEPTTFDTYCEHRTMAVNDEECRNTVMNWVQEVFGEDLHYQRLMKNLYE